MITCEQFAQLRKKGSLRCTAAELLAGREHCTNCKTCRDQLNADAKKELADLTPEERARVRVKSRIIADTIVDAAKRQVEAEGN